MSALGSGSSERQVPACSLSSCCETAALESQARTADASTLLPEAFPCLAVCRCLAMPAWSHLCTEMARCGGLQPLPMAQPCNEPGDGTRRLTMRFAHLTRQFSCSSGLRLAAASRMKPCVFSANSPLPKPVLNRLCSEGVHGSFGTTAGCAC